MCRIWRGRWASAGLGAQGRYRSAFPARLLHRKYLLGLPVPPGVQALAADGQDGHLWVFIAGDTIVFLMDPASSTAALERHFGTSHTGIATEQPHARTPEGSHACPRWNLVLAGHGLAVA
jgi:hypothetical protein